ncbi:MAG: hypothetical protein ACE366_11605 [Bradymonadia bacterium]
MYEYYFLGETRVPLKLSVQFIAVIGVSAMRQVDFETYVGLNGRFGSHEDIVYFPDYDMALIPMAEGCSSVRVDTVDLPAGVYHVPVFSSRATVGDETLYIPNGRILVQFEPHIDRETIDVMNDVSSVRIEDEGTILPNTFLLALGGMVPADAIYVANRYHVDHRVSFAEPDFIVWVNRPSGLRDGARGTMNRYGSKQAG